MTRQKIKLATTPHNVLAKNPDLEFYQRISGCSISKLTKLTKYKKAADFLLKGRIQGVSPK